MTMVKVCRPLTLAISHFQIQPSSILMFDSLSGGTFALYSLLCRHAKFSLLPNQQAADEELSAYKYGPSSSQAVASSPLKRFLEKHKLLRTALLVVVLFGACMVIGDGVLTPAISGSMATVFFACHNLQVAFFELLLLPYFSTSILYFLPNKTIIVILSLFLSPLKPKQIVELTYVGFCLFSLAVLSSVSGLEVTEKKLTNSNSFFVIFSYSIL